jgi:hypothetical protein
MTPEAIGDPEWLPLFIARVSGVAFDHMSCLATAELTKALEQYLANQRDVQHRREAVAQVLYQRRQRGTSNVGRTGPARRDNIRRAAGTGR